MCYFWQPYSLKGGSFKIEHFSVRFSLVRPKFTEVLQRIWQHQSSRKFMHSFLNQKCFGLTLTWTTQSIQCTLNNLHNWTGNQGISSQTFSKSTQFNTNKCRLWICRHWKSILFEWSNRAQTQQNTKAIHPIHLIRIPSQIPRSLQMYVISKYPKNYLKNKVFLPRNVRIVLRFSEISPEPCFCRCVRDPREDPLMEDGTRHQLRAVLQKACVHLHWYHRIPTWTGSEIQIIQQLNLLCWRQLSSAQTILQKNFLGWLFVDQFSVMTDMLIFSFFFVVLFLYCHFFGITSVWLTEMGLIFSNFWNCWSTNSQPNFLDHNEWILHIIRTILNTKSDFFSCRENWLICVSLRRVD